MDIESLAAAATILFIAGYDATAQTMQYAFHALALNQVLSLEALEARQCRSNIHYSSRLCFKEGARIVTSLERNA